MKKLIFVLTALVIIIGVVSYKSSDSVRGQFDSADLLLKEKGQKTLQGEVVHKACNHEEHRHQQKKAKELVEFSAEAEKVKLDVAYSVGDKIPFHIGQHTVTGTVNLARKDRQRLEIGGALEEGGSFSLSRVDGEHNGFVRVTLGDGSDDAIYRLEEDEFGKLIWKGIPVDNFICTKVGRAAASGVGVQSAEQQVVADVIPILNSLPGAKAVLYLDFNGEIVTHSWWNDGETIHATAWGSPSQIKEIWAQVKEDFLPFEVNVTTDVNVFENAARSLRGKCIITEESEWFSDVIPGVAYVNSFGHSLEAPSWAFTGTITASKYVAEVISHEIGHMVGLRHDGTSTGGYYGGHGEGATRWAPIMGSAYNGVLTQWSKGEYNDANNTEDDLKIITTTNGFGYRPDDYSSTMEGATDLDLTGSTVTGIIERSYDRDYFRLTIADQRLFSGNLSPTGQVPNLDCNLVIRDVNGMVLFVFNPQSELGFDIEVKLDAGIYYLEITNSGKDGPKGYSVYGSLGAYKLTYDLKTVDVSYDVSAISGVNGKISPDAVSVKSGGTASFEITPKHGYEIASLSENGNPISLSDSQKKGFTHIISGIKEDTELRVTFKALPVLRSSLISPVVGSVLKSKKVDLAWDNGLGIASNYIYVGSTKGGHNYFVSASQGNSISFEAPIGVNILHVRLWSRESVTGNWLFRDYSYGVDLPEEEASEMLSPSAGSTLTGSFADFRWTSNNRNYVYISSNLGQEYNGHAGTGLRIILRPGTTSLYFSLWTYLEIEGRWALKSYYYSVK
jgi:hypothetical protein